MDPTDPTTAQQAVSLLLEALKGLPALAVMWYMLRDVRSKVTEIVSEVSSIKLKMAGDNAHVKIEHTQEKLKDFKDDATKAIKEAEGRLKLIENQLPQLWAKVGDRPEDINRRNGVHP